MCLSRHLHIANEIPVGFSNLSKPDLPVDFRNGRLYISCMRYFTEEYFKLFAHHMDVRRIADKKYSDKEIETLKKRQLNRLI